MCEETPGEEAYPSPLGKMQQRKQVEDQEWPWLRFYPGSNKLSLECLFM